MRVKFRRFWLRPENFLTLMSEDNKPKLARFQGFFLSGNL
jgi:hypothetical protein